MVVGDTGGFAGVCGFEVVEFGLFSGCADGDKASVADRVNGSIAVYAARKRHTHVLGAKAGEIGLRVALVVRFGNREIPEFRNLSLHAAAPCPAPDPCAVR